MNTNKKTILVVDDDAQLTHLLCATLRAEGYHTDAAYDGEEALARLTEHPPDLVLLDVMLPDKNGFTLCQQIRAYSSVPIIFLTAREADVDKIFGLRLGADDYLTKPFNMDELLARIQAILRRAGMAEDARERDLLRELRVGPIVIDLASQDVSVHGKLLHLTPIEYRLLIALMRHAGRVMTNLQLQEAVWGRAVGDSHHIVQVNINRLRAKIEPDPTHPRYLLTKSRYGYCFRETLDEKVPALRRSGISA